VLVLGTGWTLAVCPAVGVHDLVLGGEWWAFVTAGCAWLGVRWRVVGIWATGQSVEEERGEFATAGNLWRNLRNGTADLPHWHVLILNGAVLQEKRHC
jgi:hypothetical protein